MTFIWITSAIIWAVRSGNDKKAPVARLLFWLFLILDIMAGIGAYLALTR